MKKVMVSTLAVLMACPAFAEMHRADQGTWQMWGMDPYIGLRGGIGYTNLNYSFNGSKESITDTVFDGRVAAGLEVCDKVRSEIEWSYYGKVKDSADFGDISNVDVSAKTQTLLWNNYWELGDWKIIRPFAGAGIGMAFTDVERSGDSSDSKTKFSAMGSMGVTFDMERFAVDLAARYNYIDVRSGLHNFGGDIGIRFMF